MKVSAELRYLPFIDLGATGRALFNRCFKLAYASADGVLFSATAVKGDMKTNGPADGQVRLTEGPHINCALICELLLSPEHADWQQVAQLIAADTTPLPDNLPQELILPRSDVETREAAAALLQKELEALPFPIPFFAQPRRTSKKRSTARKRRTGFVILLR